MITAFIIWSACAALFLYIGITARKSEKPANFFSNVNAPEVTDVKGYNKAVSEIWFIYAAGFEVCGLPLLKMKQNSPLAFLLVLGVVFLSIGIIIAYTKVENKYRNKK